MLRRLGNKAALAGKIYPLFPPHRLYIELFFEAGGMFFAKPKAKYNIVNDLDDDLYNLFDVLIHRKDELKRIIELTPKHQSLLKYWKNNEESEPILKAMRFLFLSNYTLYGKPYNLRFGFYNDKKILLSQIDKTFDYLKDVLFFHEDFRNVLSKIMIKKKDADSAFMYCDPPYLDTTNNYNSGFTENDTKDLFELMVKSGLKFAISEFDNPFVLKLSKDYNLNVNIIGERENIKNRRTEILITNYLNNQLKIDF